MPTKVFISWSGELSKKLAEAIRGWLPAVLQSVKPYFTPSDIEKGTRWNTEIVEELNDSQLGIICLTKDNLNKPWILFEAGALSKNFDKSKVCTLLFDVDPTDITGPLMMFQGTLFQECDFNELIKTINNTAGDMRLESNVLNSVFSMWWPKLEQEVNDILKSHKAPANKKQRSDRDLLEEILELVRFNTVNYQDLRFAPSQLYQILNDSLPTIKEALSNGDTDKAIDICETLEGKIRFLGVRIPAMLNALENLHFTKSIKHNYPDTKYKKIIYEKYND